MMTPKVIVCVEAPRLEEDLVHAAERDQELVEEAPRLLQRQLKPHLEAEVKLAHAVDLVLVRAVEVKLVRAVERDQELVEEAPRLLQRQLKPHLEVEVKL